MKECGECARPSSNRQFNCPPRMDDGRHFTDHRPRCVSNFMFPKDVPMNSFEYRQYLQTNADSLITNARLDAYKKNACGPCVEPYDIGTMLPEQNMMECDASTCKFIINDQNGVGLGRRYMTVPSEAEARANFLKNKQNEQAYMTRTNNCCTIPSDDLKYYSYAPVEQEYPRLTVPGGGVPMSGGDRF